MKQKIITLLFAISIVIETLAIVYTNNNEKTVIMPKSVIESNKRIEIPVEDETRTTVIKYADVNLPNSLQKWIIKYSYSNDICPYLIMAIIEKESGCNCNQIGDNGNSYGLMQINQQWHLERMKELGVTDLDVPEENIKVGISYLKELFKKDNDVEWVLNSYNGGIAYANRIQAAGITTDYSSEIIARTEQLERECECDKN